MGLFQDDFYSTKVTVRDRSPLRRTSGMPQPPVWVVAALSFILGVLITLIVVLPGKHGPATSDQAAVEASVRPTPDSPPAPVEPQPPDFQQMIIEAAHRVHPSVVSIISGVRERETKELIEYGLGSGIIFETFDGGARIVTNAHVIGNGEHIDVVLYNGERIQGELVGLDTLTDLAVVEVRGDALPQAAAFGNSDGLRAGETAIAIGNPLGLGYSHTITVGVISAPIREIDVSPEGANTWKMNVIQTDAAINQGNSGGALVNLKGEVIGINSLKILTMGVEGLGFAIPINEARPIIQDLVDYGKVKRPYLGIYTQNLAEIANRNELDLPKDVHTGVIVLEALGPAKDAGMRTGDVIVALDGEPIANTYELRKYLYEQKQINDQVEVTYYRKSERRETTVHLIEWDPE